MFTRTSSFRLSMLLILVIILLVSACAPLPPPPPTEPPAAPTAAEPTEAPTPDPRITLTDGLGREITLAGPAKAIISLSAANTEALYAIGAGDLLIARDEFSDFPEQALELPNVGGGWGEINTESVVALEPDLVLASQITTAEQVAGLEALGLTVYSVPNPGSFAELYALLLDIGILTGRTEGAQELVNALEARVTAVVEKVAAVEPVAVFYEIDASDPNAPYTVGQGTFGDMLISAAGGANVAGDQPGWIQFSLEQLVALDPPVIIFASAPFIPTTAESLSTRPGWGSLSAIVQGQVYSIDSDLVDLPGPRLVDGLEAFAAMLHPELFR